MAEVDAQTFVCSAVKASRSGEAYDAYWSFEVYGQGGLSRTVNATDAFDHLSPRSGTLSNCKPRQTNFHRLKNIRKLRAKTSCNKTSWTKIMSRTHETRASKIKIYTCTRGLRVNAINTPRPVRAGSQTQLRVQQRRAAFAHSHHGNRREA